MDGLRRKIEDAKIKLTGEIKVVFAYSLFLNSSVSIKYLFIYKICLLKTTDGFYNSNLN